MRSLPTNAMRNKGTFSLVTPNTDQPSTRSVTYTWKRKLIKGFSSVHGKLFIVERMRYCCEVGLYSIKQYLNGSNFLIHLQYHRAQYQGMENLRQIFNQETTILFLDQKVRNVTQWKEGLDQIILQFRRSLRGTEPIENDDFWVKLATTEYTLELSTNLKKANGLVEILEKLTKEILATKNAIEI